MSDRSAFLSAIIANPDDDAPRLIYADWLEEHGESERAEFIRVQIAAGVFGVFALTTSNYYGEDFHEGEPYPVVWGADPKPRELAGMATMYRHWAMFQNGIIQYTRGFLSAITCTAADFLANADAILSEHPVQEVTLTTWPSANEIDSLLIRAGGVVNLRFPGGTDNRPNMKYLLGKCWPQIKTWELQATMAYQIVQRDYLRRVAQSFSVPTHLVGTTDSHSPPSPRL